MGKLVFIRWTDIVNSSELNEIKVNSVFVLEKQEQNHKVKKNKGKIIIRPKIRVRMQEPLMLNIYS